MIRALKNLINRFPGLRLPARLCYAALLDLKNAFLYVLVVHLGYKPQSLSFGGQDRWVIDEVFRGKRDGFFLDLGAADGFSESNTYILEKIYGWRGICIEPNPLLFKQLTEKFKRTCTCVQKVVDAEESDVEFMFSGQMGGIIHEDTDNNPNQRSGRIEKSREAGRINMVKTTTLEKILDQLGAPSIIDYFTIDVEGAETRILRNFPFDKYTFLALTIERPSAELNAVLFGNGYRFVRNSVEDTFYVHESVE